MFKALEDLAPQPLIYAISPTAHSSIFWETNLKPWDVAAGMLIVTEAGGKITRFDGSKMELDTMELLATNSLLHNKSVELLKE